MEGKRSRWRPSEIKELLNIIKEEKIVSLLDGKVKRNKCIFVDIQKYLYKAGVNKSDEQIRSKYKCLKREFLKCKRHNNISGNSRSECEYFTELDEIFAHRPLAAVAGIDTCAETFLENFNNAEMEFLEAAPPTLEATIPSTPATTSLEATIPEATTTPTPATSSSESLETPMTSQCSMRTFRNTKKRSYQSTLTNFSEEWKKMQQDLMKHEKEMVDKLNADEAEHLSRLEKILKEDREEYINAFKDIVENFKKQ